MVTFLTLGGIEHCPAAAAVDRWQFTDSPIIDPVVWGTNVACLVLFFNYQRSFSPLCIPSFGLLSSLRAREPLSTFTSTIRQLKLVSHDDGPKTAAAATAAAAAPTAPAGAAPAQGPGRFDVSRKDGGNAAKEETCTQEEEQESLLSPSAGGADTVVSVSAGARETGRQGMTVVGGDGSDGGGGEGEQFGEAMIDEAEYTEEHHEEQRLFEDMQKLLTVRPGGERVSHNDVIFGVEHQVS